MNTPTNADDSTRMLEMLEAINGPQPGERPLEEQYPARDPAGPPDVLPGADDPRVTVANTITPPVNPNVEKAPTYPDGDGLEHTKTDNPPRDQQGIDGQGHWSK